MVTEADCLCPCHKFEGPDADALQAKCRHDKATAAIKAARAKAGSPETVTYGVRRTEAEPYPEPGHIYYLSSPDECAPECLAHGACSVGEAAADPEVELADPGDGDVPDGDDR